MKKQWILIFTLIFGNSLAFAGTFKADDFNQMIQDNQKAENELRSRLQKEAGIELNGEKPGTIAKEKIQPPAEAEQVVVSSSQPIWKDAKDRSEKTLHKAKMKRVSQELEEALEN